MNQFPAVKCKSCSRLFESQIKIAPKIYRMVPNFLVGINTFRCPYCNSPNKYSEDDFLYSPELSLEMNYYGREIKSENILIVNVDDPIIDDRVEWVGPLISRLIFELHKHKKWEKITPRQLEEIVAELFAGFDYTVELTKQTRDRGRDIIAIKRKGVIVPQKYLIECKHWKAKVDVKIVRELMGAANLDDERPSGLIIASTSGFTRDALLLSESDQSKWILSLKDKNDLEEWVKDYFEKKKPTHRL